MSGTRSVYPREPAINRRLRQAALLICGYGSVGGGGAMERRARALGRKAAFAETAGCTLFGEPMLEDVVGSLSGAPILLVPLFMAKGVTHAALRERLRRLGAAGPVILCQEIGAHPGLPREVAGHARQDIRRRGWTPRETGLLLIGHGSRRHAASRRSVGRLAGAIAAMGVFAETAMGFLDEEPGVERALQAVTAKHVLAVGCFTEAGRHATRDLPERLAASGRPAAYGGPIGTADWIDPLILDQALHGARRFAEGAGQINRSQHP